MYANMKNKKTQHIISRIEKIKLLLQGIGEMRPGSLTQQSVILKSGNIYQPWQISYTHKMKSRTKGIKPEFVKQTKLQIENYKKFKELTTEWVDLAIELATLKMEI